MNTNLKLKTIYIVSALILPITFLIFLYYFNFGFLDFRKNNQDSNENGNKVELSFEDFYNHNNFDSANKLLDLKLEKNPSSVILLIQKAKLLSQEASLKFKEKELGDKARSYALQALTIEPENTVALTLVGYTYEIQENYKKAHEYYDKALKIDPKDINALVQKGHAYMLEGNIAEANKFTMLAAKIDPKNENISLSLAKMYLINNQPEKALDIYNLSIANAKNNRVKAASYYGAGTIYENQKDLNQAKKYYLAAKNTDKDFTQAYVALGRVYFLQRNYPDSFSELSEVLEMNPNQTSALLQLTIQFISVGDKESATKTLESLKNKISKDISLSSIDKEMVRVAAQSLQEQINNIK